MCSWQYSMVSTVYLFGFYVAFNTVQVISRRVVGRAEETSTYSSLGFCTVNCRPTASNCQLSHLRPCRESNPRLRGGRRECYHSATTPPPYGINKNYGIINKNRVVCGNQNCIVLTCFIINHLFIQKSTFRYTVYSKLII